jgi:hypothetical protein
MPLIDLTRRSHTLESIRLRDQQLEPIFNKLQDLLDNLRTIVNPTSNTVHSTSIDPYCVEEILPSVQHRLSAVPSQPEFLPFDREYDLSIHPVVPPPPVGLRPRVVQLERRLEQLEGRINLLDPAIPPPPTTLPPVFVAWDNRLVHIESLVARLERQARPAQSVQARTSTTRGW